MSRKPKPLDDPNDPTDPWAEGQPEIPEPADTPDLLHERRIRRHAERVEAEMRKLGLWKEETSVRASA